MASEVKLPPAGKNEFQKMQDDIVTLKDALARASAGVQPTADVSVLDAYDEAVRLVADLRARAQPFERRASEKDPDKKIYGPKMVQKVLDFCTALEEAAEHADDLDGALVPLRERRAQAEAEAAAAEAAAAEAAVVAEREAAAAADAERAQAEEAARLEAERQASERAKAIAAPLPGMADGPSAASATAGPMDELGRRDVQRGLTLAQALELLLTSGVATLDVANALQALHLLCQNIVARPEERMFRTIRLLNGAFQEVVARHAGGVEALLALGFVESESLEEEDALFFILEEPSLEHDPTSWADWYDGIKAGRDVIYAQMETLGVRALPVASKGTGWSEEVRANPVRACQADILTLHGQKGGGL